MPYTSGKFTFDTRFLTIAVSKDELIGLLSGKQTAILKNTCTLYFPGLKCYLYETQKDGGRGKFVAIGEIKNTTHLLGLYNLDEQKKQAIYDCGLTIEEAEKIVTFRHGGIVFYINNISEVEDPDALTQDLSFYSLRPPITVQLIEK